MVTRALKPVIGLFVDALVEAVVVLVDEVAVHIVELLQTGDFRHIHAEQQLFLDPPPIPLLLALGGPIPGGAMDNNDTQCAADEGELLIGVGSTVVQQQLARNAVGGNGVLQHLLEVGGVTSRFWT